MKKIKKATILSITAIIIVFIVIPYGILKHQANKKGVTLNEFIKRTFKKSDAKSQEEVINAGTNAKGNKIITKNFLIPQKIGNPVKDKPWITHLDIVDLDQDNLKDIVLCDAKANEIHWLRQYPAGTYTETVIGTKVMAPAHVTPGDIDQDGDIDLLIASMGMIFPNNDKIGSVVVLENTGDQKFVNRFLIQNTARVTDVSFGDLDQDGDLDLAIGQFGYDDGEIRWMENLGNWEFKSTVIQNLSGCIHVPIVDIDGDGDLDIVALVSQEWEEIYIFENDGKANFKTNMIYGATNEDFGSSGIYPVDLDLDGDLDVLYSCGDAFDYIPPTPRPWHGVQWLENKGKLKFEYHRIGDFNGAFSPRPIDVDLDGDLDVVAVSCFNLFKDKKSQSMVWFENDGSMNFRRYNITNTPTHLLSLEIADMDGDNQIDIVTGGMYAYPPFDRMSRVILWKNAGLKALKQNEK